MFSIRSIAIASTIIGGALSMAACTTIGEHPAAYQVQGVPTQKMEVPKPQGETLPQYKAVGAFGFITWYQGFPGQRGHAVTPTSEDLNKIAYAIWACKQELGPQLPDYVPSVGYRTLIDTTEEVGGLAAGVAWGYPNAAQKAVRAAEKEATGEGIVGGFIEGATQYPKQERTIIVNCASRYIQYAAGRGEFRRGIWLSQNPFDLNGHPISASYSRK